MTLADFITGLQTRAIEADAMRATAPLAETLRWVVAELAPLAADGNAHRPAPPAATDEELLTPKEAASLMGMSVRFVYAHKNQLGACAVSRRALRIPKSRIARFLARRV